MWLSFKICSRQQDPNIYSDTEARCLVYFYTAVQLAVIVRVRNTINVLHFWKGEFPIPTSVQQLSSERLLNWAQVFHLMIKPRTSQQISKLHICPVYPNLGNMIANLIWTDIFAQPRFELMRIINMNISTSLKTSCNLWVTLQCTVTYPDSQCTSSTKKEPHFVISLVINTIQNIWNTAAIVCS